MICLILLIILNCKSTNYYEVNGVKNELFTKRQGNYINDISSNRTDDRTNYNYHEAIEKIEIRDEEVTKVEDLNSIITAVGSAIAGIYCAVKTIINTIKKIKNKN